MALTRASAEPHHAVDIAGKVVDPALDTIIEIRKSSSETTKAMMGAPIRRDQKGNVTRRKRRHSSA